MTQPLDPELEAGLHGCGCAGCANSHPSCCRPPRPSAGRPTKLLATLVREELASRDASNQRARLKAAGFPAPRPSTASTSQPSRSKPTFEYLASLEWLERNENLCLVGPAGDRQEPPRPGPRARRHHRRPQGPLLPRRPTHRSALPRPGRQHRRQAHRTTAARTTSILIDELGFAALDRVAADHLFRFVAAAYEQRSIAIATNVTSRTGPSSCPNTPPPPHPRPLPPPRHVIALTARATACAKPATAPSCWTKPATDHLRALPRGPQTPLTCPNLERQHATAALPDGPHALERRSGSPYGLHLRDAQRASHSSDGGSMFDRP